MASYQVFISFLCLSLSLVLPLCNCACHPQDRAALAEIDRITNYSFAPSGVNLTEDCCQWNLVLLCNSVGRVTWLLLDGQILSPAFSGQLPEAIGQLTYLDTLTISNVTNLRGPLPSSMANLKHLTQIDIKHTSLSGPVPEWLGRFSKLYNLILRDCRFTGQIPASLANLPKLQYLEISGNQMTGTIPDSFGRFVGSWPAILLHHNNLSGSIPKSFQKAKFPSLFLNNNQLEGDLSPVFKNRAGQLFYVDASSNRLEFDLSPVVFPPSLTNVKLAHNRIYGSIPEAIVNQTGLSEFDVSYNRLCGRIPQGGAVADVPQSSYVHNKCLCGPPLSKKC